MVNARIFQERGNSLATSTTPLARRTFLAGIGAVGATVALPTVAASAQQAQQGGGSDHVCGDTCETMTVWRLDADWGYPRGPHGKTKLESKASLSAAKNRWALTEQDALDMNLHLCSWAPAVAVEVNKCAFMEVWDHNGAGAYDWKNPWNGSTPRIFDERCLPHIDDTGELWKRALDTSCDTSSGATGASGSTGSTGTTGTTSTNTLAGPTTLFGTNSSSTTAGATSAADTAADSISDDVPNVLAYTGSSPLAPAAAATGMMAVGGVLAILARRRREVAEAAEAAQH